MNCKKGLALTCVTIGGLLFYWFEVRPAQIKHSCSWTKFVEKAQPAYPAMSELELRGKGLLQTCPTPLPKAVSSDQGGFLSHRLDTLCEMPNKELIEQYAKPRKAIPSKTQWRKASEEEYRFCLRDKGL